jgi:hypothetical protein
MPETLLDVYPLPTQLLLISKILPLAAAAEVEMGTEGRLVRGGLLQEPDHPGFSELGFFPGNPHPHLLPGNGLIHENHETIHSSQGFAAISHFFYSQIKFESWVQCGKSGWFLRRSHLQNLEDNW